MPGDQSPGDGASLGAGPPPPSSSSNGPHAGSGQQGGGGGRRRLWPRKQPQQPAGGGAGAGRGGVGGGKEQQQQQQPQPAWRQKPPPDAHGNMQSDQQQRAVERLSNNGNAAQQTSSEQSSNNIPTTPATAGVEAKVASTSKAVKAVIKDQKSSSKGDRPELGHFIAYLPRDSNGSDAQTQAAINTINEQLATVLRLPAKEFWQFVVRDASLMKCLDSYLRFRRRPADIEAQTETRVSVPGEEELARRVFMTLYRMSSPKSSEIASDGLPAQQHGEMLYQHWLFDVPMLMDICAIYGPHNPKLTAQLVSNVLTAQPKYLDDMRKSGAQLATTLNELCDRCENTAVELVTRDGAATVDTHRVATEMIDVAEFLHDMCHTLDAFVTVYPAAAALLVTAAGPSNEKLLLLLARVHDSIVSPLERGLSALLSGTKDGTPEALLRDHAARLVSHVRRRTRALSWTLLHSAYFIAPAIKDTEALGGELMGTLADMSGIVGSATTPTLLQIIERRFHLSHAVDQATKSGDMRVDDVQLEFLHSLLGSNASAATAGTTHTSAPVQKLQPTVAQLPDRRIAKQQQQTDSVEAAEAAAQSSLITQIQDVLPEYGAGFLAACLDVYDNDPEKVMHHILDGSLPDDLASLDTTLHTKPAKPTTFLTDKGKGKAVLHEPEMDKKGKGKVVGPSLYGDSTAGSSSLSLREAGPGPSSSAASAAVSATGVTGRYVRKTTGDESMASVLDTREFVDESVRAIAFDAQYEYDDEYDDSYDELLYTTNSDETADAAMEAVKINTNTSNRQSAGFHDGPQMSNKPALKQPQPSSSQAPSNSTMYEKDGKLYNYKKDGAQKTTQAQFEAAKAAAATAIHGLGAGGNKRVVQPRADKRVAQDDDLGEDDNMEKDGGDGDHWQDGTAAHVNQTAARGRGRGGAPNQPRREHHSGFVGKHRRREGALKKHLAGLGGH